MRKIPKTREELAKCIDHTLLKPNMTTEDVIRLINEAKTYGFRGVCVPIYWIPYVKNMLKDTNILIVTVVGFPFGYEGKEIKVYEATKAVEYGADEIDMVMNISAFKSGQYDLVEEEIKAVVKAVSPKHVKVIIETSFLTEDEIITAAKIVAKSGARFVKTNTGFGKRGVEIRDIELIRSAIGNEMGVKASGGIKDAKKALKLIVAGADVIGASAGVEIVNSFDQKILEEI